MKRTEEQIRRMSLGRAGYHQVRCSEPGNRRMRFLLPVPREVARLIPEGSYFKIEIVKEGILYRKVELPDVPVFIQQWRDDQTKEES